MIHFNKLITKVLIRLHGCACWSVPLLFATPKDRFSCVQAHIHDTLHYPFNDYAQISRGASSLKFGLSLHLHPYFVYESSKGCESLQNCAGPLKHWLLADWISTKILCASSYSKTWPRGYKTFFMFNSIDKMSTAHKEIKYRQMNKFLALSLSDVVFIMLINVKMLTIVGILTFISRINFVLS